MTANGRKGFAGAIVPTEEMRPIPEKNRIRPMEVAAASSQTDQLPRTEETPMPKTASHGPF